MTALYDRARFDDLNLRSARTTVKKIARRKRVVFLRVRYGAQSKGQTIRHLLRHGYDLCLFRGQLQRRCGPHDGRCSVLAFLNLLIDREDTDVVQDVFCQKGVIVALADHDDIDTIVRKNKTACSGCNGNFRGHRAFASRQERRHDARAGIDDFFRSDRLTFKQRQPHDRASKLGDGVGPLRVRDETVNDIALRPWCPSHGAIVKPATDRQIDGGDKNVDRRLFLDDRFRFFDNLLCACYLHGDNTGETGCDQGNGKNDNTRRLHARSLRESDFSALRMARDWYNYG
ncbi:hypothetical protein AT6N2_C2319 [Agrobacterium tumefaciens]|nr:hypothetical protein AT6N2_C2319 [Agrobacterium tumefaciens]